MKKRILRCITVVLYKKLLLSFFSMLIFTCLAFSMETKSSKNQEKVIFQLHILRGDSFKMLGNTYEEAIQALKKMNLSIKSEFVITEHDIKSYNWSNQSIDLTLDKSMEILRKYVSEDINREDFLTGKYSWSDIEYALHALAFLIMLEDEILYGGIFMKKVTSLGPSYPVIYLEPGTEVSLEPFKLQISLMVRPLPLPFLSDSYTFMKPYYLKQGIEIHQIYDFFSKIGKLTD